MQLLTFTLDGINFGILLEDVEFVVERSNEIVEVPSASAHIKGIVTIRGGIVPIYSLASRFGYSEEKMRYVIIVNIEGMRLGIGVDRLNAVMDTIETEVLTMPSLLSGENNCLHNIVVAGQKQFIILIDVNSLVPHEEKVEIHQLIAGNE